MAEIGFVEAFARFKAKLVNHMWAVSAISEDGELVISCWAHYFKKVDGELLYLDSLSRWNGNEAGNKLLKEHIEKAFYEHLDVRIVLATAEDPTQVDNGHDASKVKKKFRIREDLVGKLREYDGDNFVIQFPRK